MQNQKENIGVVVSFVIVACLIGFVIYMLMHQATKEDPLKGINNVGTIAKVDEPKATAESATPSQQKNMEPNKNVKLMKDFIPVAKTAELKKIDLIVGNGEEVKSGATVSVHYTGAVASTGAIFQSSKDFGSDPVTFPLSGVIKGWTNGIPGMKIGGTRRLVIPAEQAYGSTPPPGSGIPANADLVFDVELVAIK